MPDTPAPCRRTARVLCVDGDRVLLMRTHWLRRLAEPRWLTPGGGIDEGETEREAAVRELFEETGQRVRPDDLVGPIWHSRQPHPPGHSHAASDATYFVWRTPAFEVSREHWMPDEVDDILDVRWWSRAELAATDEVLSGEDVLAMLARLDEARPEPGDAVSIVGSKWHGTAHWRYDAEVLGTDDQGVWIGTWSGAPVRKGKRQPWANGHAFVRLVPWPPDVLAGESWDDGAWMLPGVWIGHPEVAAYIDVTTPPSLRKEGDRWIVEYTDLDLDLVVPVDAPAWLDDEDEFASRSRKHGWPEWVVDRTRATGDALLRDARAGALPLFEAGRSWAARFVASR